MSTYGKHFTTPGPATSPAIGQTNMVQNNTGGYTFVLSPIDHLRRFLILGADGATYYAGKSDHFRQAYQGALKAVKTLGTAAVDEILAIRTGNRAPKQDATIFALALCATQGDSLTRAAAFKAIATVCVTPTQLFSFLNDYKALGGKTGGRAMKRTLQNWYLDKDPARLAYLMVKYRQREGWTHRDVLRLCKPAGHTTGVTAMGDVLAFGAGRTIGGIGSHLDVISAYESLKENPDPRVAAKFIRDVGLPREAVPDGLLKSEHVWRALLMPSKGNKYGMPMTAMIRNLNRMTVAGILGYNSAETMHVVNRLTDPVALKKGRIHPIAVLSALRTYASGQGARGSLTWTPNAQVVSALERAFMLSFDSAPTTNLRYYVGLDVSGSMGSGEIAGVPGLTPREASAAMAMLWGQKEPFCMVKGFTATGSFWQGGSNSLTDLTGPFKSQGLQDCVRAVSNLNFGATDPSLVIKDALDNKIPVDVFVIMTDNEVNGGSHHFQMLKQYRKAMGIEAKVVVIGMTATNFTIADPNDPGMLDVVGFDAAAHSIIADFASR